MAKVVRGVDSYKKEFLSMTAKFCSVFESIDASPNDLFSAVDVPSNPLIRAATVSADQSFG